MNGLGLLAIITALALIWWGAHTNPQPPEPPPDGPLCGCPRCMNPADHNGMCHDCTTQHCTPTRTP